MLVGMGRMDRINSLSVNLSYIVASDVRGYGYATEIIEALCARAKTYGYRSALADISIKNMASLMSLARNRFEILLPPTWLTLTKEL